MMLTPSQPPTHTHTHTPPLYSQSLDQSYRVEYALPPEQQTSDSPRFVLAEYAHLQDYAPLW